MNPNLEKLNRLRINAGKSELKSWKASSAKLKEAIKVLEDSGYTDALPGANVEAAPVTPDIEIAKNHPPLEESGFMKSVVNLSPPKSKDPVTPRRTALARGLNKEPFAQQCRQKIKDARAKEKASNITGRVDPKKDPAKAKRQEEHVKAKQKARAEKKSNPVDKPKSDEITVADLARELGIDPKVARAKLRRHEEKISPLHTPGQDRWTFPMKAADQLRALLKGGRT